MKKYILTGCVTLICAGHFGAGALASENDSPLVFFQQIGAVKLGMSAVQVEYMLGAPLRTQPYTAENDYIFSEAIYRVPGGTLGVIYFESGSGRVFGKPLPTTGTVVALETTSPRYRSVDGIRAGMTIPLGACHRASGTCTFRWRTWVWDQPCVPAWYRWKGRLYRGPDAYLFTDRGKVTRIITGLSWATSQC